MKIYNKKGLFFGIFWASISGFNLIMSCIRPHSDMFKLSITLLCAIVLFLYGVRQIIRAFSKNASEEDYVQRHDAHNVMMLHKTKARTMDIMLGVIVLCMAVSIIGYSRTLDTMWMLLLLQSGLLFTVAWIAGLVITLYYETHEKTEKH